LRVLSDRDAKPEILTFHLDDNYGWDDGLICGGRMTILADPMNNSGRLSTNSTYFQQLRLLVEAGRGCTEAVILTDEVSGAAPADRFLFDADNRLVNQISQGPMPESVARLLVPIQQRPRPEARHGIAFLPFPGRITLTIVGGGHVGQAVAKLASEVDFDIRVLDDRQAYISAERFPTARQRVSADIGTMLRQMAPELGPSDYCLIVTRGHSHDEEALYHLAGSRAAYVGMIGSRRKIKMIFEDLVARGVSPEALERVHAPLGIAIGSQTVPEIAISIVAELIACRNLGTATPAAHVAEVG
jgi:xanthine dehydrogenase accessory factor